MSDELFFKLSDFLYRRTGIRLSAHKKYLMSSRLSPHVGPGKSYRDYLDLYKKLKKDPEEILPVFINSLTTNFSYFFRDPLHFQVLVSYLRETLSSQSYQRLWSAAASTGEEAYSMAISLLRNPGCMSRDCRILGTDISTKVLAKANQGLYPAPNIRKIFSTDEVPTYFTPTESPDYLRINQNVRSLISFRQLNLFSDYPFKRHMDVVFLRNVLIYFSNEAKEEAIRRIHRCMKPGGLLLIGLSESLVGIRHGFRMYKNSVYLKEED